MGIRKFKADYLFTGRELLNSDAVLMADDYGVVTGISSLADAGDDIEIYEGILSPGFINTHCHVELSHMKGKIPEATGLVEFLTRVIKERNFDESVITRAMLSAASEMFNSGIVAIGDICNTTDSIRIKKESNLNWHNFIEVIGFNPHDATARLAFAAKVMAEFKTIDRPEIANEHSATHASLSPHAPYSVSKSLFELINEASANEIITIHNQESDAENELYLNKSGQLLQFYKNLNIDAVFFEPTGRTSLQSYLPWLNKPSGIILVHNVFPNAEDLLFGRDNNKHPADIYFCVCINANRYIQSVNPPIDLLIKNQCVITLGTDSYASNHQLNILEEMKTIHQEFPDVPMVEMLQWATINGAKALKMDSKLGSFDRGKQPGIVLISNIEQQHLSARSTSKRLL